MAKRNVKNGCDIQHFLIHHITSVDSNCADNTTDPIQLGLIIAIG